MSVGIILTKFCWYFITF